MINNEEKCLCEVLKITVTVTCTTIALNDYSIVNFHDIFSRDSDLTTSVVRPLVSQ